MTELFDSQQVLDAWDFKKEQQKAEFIEHLYQVYKPDDHCYTGLWERFLHEEAGLYCRDLFFDRLEAVRQFQQQVDLTKIKDN
jgi:hypothetical protein